jgi:hypothetical protein
LAGLTPKQAVFVAAYLGEANRNATEAARIAGYANPGQRGHELVKKREIQDAINDQLSIIKRQGIQLQQNRINGLAERHQLLLQVVEERATAMRNDAPGGSTGLLVEKVKETKFGPRYEYAVDTGLLRELRELEKHIAQELGEWTEKSEVSTSGSLSLDFAGIDVPLPDRDDAPPDQDSP